MKKITRIIVILFFFTMLLGLASCSKNEATPTTTTTTEEKTGKNVYFAAPLFSQGEREYNLKLVNIIESYGYKVFLPQRDGFLAPELEGLTEEQKIKKIFDKDCEEVLKADILVILLDGRVPDEGACVELGIAYSNHKRCYGLKSDARSVELDMDLNPMITGCLNKLFYNLNGNQLIEDLKAYLESNTL